VKPRLIYSISVSADGLVADRDGAFGWTAPSEELSRFHIALLSELGGSLCGRRPYATMPVCETDPSLRDSELRAAFADAWCAIPKVVFSRTLDSVQGNARLRRGIGGRGGRCGARRDRQGCLDRRRRPGRCGDRARPGRRAAHVPLSGVVGGGTPFLPPVTEDVPLERIETRTFGSRVIYERYGRAR
jgi:hypothetical protein